MAALTEALQHQAEQNPTASYYNLVLLRYQVRRSRDRARAGHINYANTESALRPLLATHGTAYGPAWTRLGLGDSGCIARVAGCGNVAQPPLSFHS